MSDKHISAEALTLSLRDDPNLNAASFARVKRHIEAAPDMVKRGKWVHKGAWHIECAECKYILAHIGEAKNYCPNCGAKMDGGNEDEKMR